MRADPLSDLGEAVESAIGLIGETAQRPTLERPKQAELGDYSTNAAMLLAPALGQTPRDIAATVSEKLQEVLQTDLKHVDVAGPGFVNIFLTDHWHRASASEALSAERFGSGPQHGPAVHLEFVSANPTGPLTAAGGRGAAYGDSLARVLEMGGQSVSREYYLNDAGSQIRVFAESIAAQMKGSQPPENGYSGAYIADLAKELASEGLSSDDLDGLATAGAEAMRAKIEATLERFSVRFDAWASEKSLHETGALQATLDELEPTGYVFETGGALWLRTSDWGDDKDRVLIKSDGEPTYFASDVAYHRDKLKRGAEQMIVPLGADHHGYLARMKAAVGIITGDPDRYEAPIMQLVNIVERGERSRMSKRRGEFVTLDELIDDIGADAARFFLLQRSNDTVIDLDLELAREQSQENPVYYVQYAHARIAGILARAKAGEGASVHDVPCAPSEKALIRRLLEFPSEVSLAAERRAPHRLCTYAMSVAADFHAFYANCRVVDADSHESVEGLEAARAEVCRATQRVIAESLSLLGVSAPDQM